MGSQCISSPPAELGSDFGRDGPEAGTKVSLLSCFSPLVLLGKWCLRAFGICFGALELVSKAGAVLSQGGPQLKWVIGARLRLSQDWSGSQATQRHWGLWCLDITLT